ncbi:MAG: diacylglycerol/lipid kinase family protein [Mycobacterium leprae]
MPRLCFIVNPTAGHGRALKTWKQVEPVAASLGEYGVKFTERPRHGEELARQAAAEGYDRVVALGGDGTLNEVGNGLVGTNAAMAVVPTGTGNDWVRTVGIPRDPVVATQIAFNGRVIHSDVGLAHGYRYFFNIAGIGFDAEVSRRVNDYGPVLKTIGGTLPSLLGIAGTLFHFMGARTDVRLDGQPRTIPQMLLMAVGIARYYGGGMKVLPDAMLDDGQFEVVWGEDLTRLQLIRLAAQIYDGGHVGHPKVTFARCQRVEATADTPVAFHLDGDVVGNLPVTFELIPGALKVVVPSGPVPAVLG